MGGGVQKEKAAAIAALFSGLPAARAVPADWPFEKAWREIADYLRLCEFYCERYDIDVAIEPLRIGECNILNYVSEAVAISSLLALPRIGALGDSYHMACGHEPFEALTRAGGTCSTCTCAASPGAIPPCAPTPSRATAATTRRSSPRSGPRLPPRW